MGLRFVSAELESIELVDAVWRNVQSVPPKWAENDTSAFKTHLISIHSSSLRIL